MVKQHSKFCFQRHIGLIRPKIATNSTWLYYLLLTPQIQNQAAEKATGTAQKTVSLKALRTFKIPLVSVCNQEKSVEILDDLSLRTQQLSSIYRQKLTALTELKQSLIQKAFSGELTADKLETEVEQAAA
jgi:type I restriction enzyme S subunit